MNRQRMLIANLVLIVLGCLIAWVTEFSATLFLSGIVIGTNAVFALYNSMLLDFHKNIKSILEKVKNETVIDIIRELEEHPTHEIEYWKTRVELLRRQLNRDSKNEDHKNG